jgi:hypothetical protein
MGMVEAPFYYHDGSKELALVFLPLSLNLKREDQERLIGRLSNAVLDALPQDRKRMYVLQPKVVFSWDSFLEEAMQAEGISPDTLRRQRSHLDLIDRLAGLEGGDIESELEAQPEHTFGFDFLMLLAAAIRRADETGDDVRQERLERARQAVLRRAPDRSAGPAMTYDEVIDAVDRAEAAGSLGAVVEVYRPLLDYAFYQALSQRIEAAEAEESERLRALRNKVLEASEHADERIKAELRVAAANLQRVLGSSDPRRALDELGESVNNGLLVLLQGNIEHARRTGQDQAASQLEAIHDLALTRLEERQPAITRILSRLLRAKSDEERLAILKRSTPPPELLDVLQATADAARLEGRAGQADEIGSVAALARRYLRDRLRPDDLPS